MSGRVFSINISDKKGISKKEINLGTLKENFGLLGDAHAKEGSKRQVSLLNIESIKKLGNTLGPGDFAENITTEGFNLSKLKIGDRIKIGEEIILEISQVGKVCHTKCEIFYKLGDCIMPKQGIFAKVIKGGMIKKGERIYEI